MDGGNGVGVGDTHNGAKVVEIGPDWVRLEFEGKPLTLYVFGEGSAPSGGGPGPTRPPAMAGPPPGGPSSQPPVAVARPVSRGPREGPTLTPEQLAHIRAELAKMPPEERERAMASAPEHIRAQLAE